MNRIKIVIAGSYGAGKTQFVNSASEIETVSTEVDLADTSGVKKTTTVAMDYGRLTFADTAQELNIFGTPGQDYMDFMWDVLSNGMQGMIFLVDSSAPDSLEEAKAILSRFDKTVPLVVVANKQDYSPTISIAQIRSSLQLEKHVKVIPCNATKKENVVAILRVIAKHFN
jgi:hypothetical protein